MSGFAIQRFIGPLALALLMAVAPLVRAQITFERPPEVGDHLQPQARLIHCKTARAAEFSSRTGFIGNGCTPLVERDTWLVIRCTLVALDEGDMWLVEIQNPADERRFVPIPWHDWA